MTAANTALTAINLADKIRSGILDPVAHIGAVLDLCERENRRLNALTTIDRPRSLADAVTIRDRLKAGESLPLAGVPIVVKDNIWAKGWPSTQGSKLFEGFVPDVDAIGVARARAAGAVVVGIGTCSEFACLGRTNTLLHGITRHPLDETLTPGGSSGGNSAAVGAGMVPLAIGTDGGGSSRRPPAHCGIVGFKPSVGAVAHPFSFPEPFWGLSSICPMARNVADAALLFEVMQGPDPRDAESRRIHPRDKRPLASLRIAVAMDVGLGVPADIDVAEAFDAAVAAIRAAGITLVPAAPAWPRSMHWPTLAAIQHAGLAAIHGDRARATPDQVDPDVMVQIERGYSLPATVLADAIEASRMIRAAVGSFFADFDLLLTLTTPCVAWPNSQLYPPFIGGMPAEPRGHAAFTPMFNHAQVPALSLPCGYGHAGLPVGLQIIAGRDHDWRVLDAAAQIEGILGAAACWRGNAAKRPAA